MKHAASTKKRVIMLAQKGKTFAAIQADTGVSRNTIRTWLDAAGMPRSINPGAPYRYPREEIEALLAKDVPRAKICKKYGCSEKWLSQLANGHLKVKP